MSDYSNIPSEIKKHFPCSCCYARNDNGTYRVYRYSSLKKPDGRWTRTSGTLIGKILPGIGFVPNKRYMREEEEKAALESADRVVFMDEITDVAYGNYGLLLWLSTDVYNKLKSFFGLEEATQIYTYALILCANGFLHIDQIDDFYQESYLSVLYGKFAFRMGYTALSNLLHDLGKKTNPVRKFEQSLIDESSGNVAIDGHVIRSCSENNDLAEPGYKAKELKSSQTNLLIAYDTHGKMPLLYRTFRGSSVDKRSVIDLLEQYHFENVKFVVDRGFYSEEVLGLMSKNGNTYIIPLQTSNKNVKRIKAHLAYTSGEFVYKSSKKETARIVYYEEPLDEKTRIIVYKDMDENNSKRKSYQQYMDLGESGYTQEGYDRYCEWWGVYFLQTTATDSAPVIFGDYKNRWSIETFNNYIKNDAGFNNLKIQDYYVEHGFDFIMLVTGMIHSHLNDAVVAMNKSSISTFDILIKAGHMRMVHEGDIWRLRNTRTKDLDLLKTMGFVPDREYDPNPVEG